MLMVYIRVVDMAECISSLSENDLQTSGETCRFGEEFRKGLPVVKDGSGNGVLVEHLN